MRESDHLDWVRAALCAFSYQSPKTARPVHIHRLNWYAARTAPGLEVQRSLAVLERIREVQRLAQGHWLPTPTRSVPIDAIHVLVSALPTRELQRRWGDTVLLGDGACRTTSRQLTEIPCESFRSWLGAPADMPEWTATQYRDAAKALCPAEFNQSELEILQLNHTRSALAWKPAPEAFGAVAPDELLLCRPVAEERRAEIFIAQHRNARLTAQASVLARNRRRLVWGTARQLGLRVVPTVSSDASRMQFELPQRLPPEEERLISALGSIRYSGSAACHYCISHAALSITKTVLGQLGIAL
jgi:hypothetical protein